MDSDEEDTMLFAAGKAVIAVASAAATMFSMMAAVVADEEERELQEQEKQEMERARRLRRNEMQRRRRRRRRFEQKTAAVGAADGTSTRGSIKQWIPKDTPEESSSQTATATTVQNIDSSIATSPQRIPGCRRQQIQRQIKAEETAISRALL
jgi:hypothetical protein